MVRSSSQVLWKRAKTYTTISNVKDFNCHIGTSICFWLFGVPGRPLDDWESLQDLATTFGSCAIEQMGSAA